VTKGAYSWARRTGRQEQLLAHFHIGDLITSIYKVSMVADGREVLLNTCLYGTIVGACPSRSLPSKEDIDFILTLEQHIHTEQTSLVGRDHLAWRGYYVPVKAVVDEDLCETFSMLPPGKQCSIAGELDRIVGESSCTVTASGFREDERRDSLYVNQVTFLPM
jgi:splicing factor 3B subunit 3